MGVKNVKVKTLSDKYGVSTKEILKELEEQGFDIKSASSVIPADVVELIEAHFDELMEKKKRKEKEDKEKETKAKAGGIAVASASAPATTQSEVPEVHIKGPIVVKHLAELTNKKPNEIIASLMSMNILASINQTIDQEVATKLCTKLGFKFVADKREKEEHQKQQQQHQQEQQQLPVEETETVPASSSSSSAASEAPESEDAPQDLKSRAPVVTFLGHVDHGKTSLQDAIRKTEVAAGEAGGITQHIGASVVSLDGKSITFIDTPGHEAFTAMRARGANATDIAVLVVAADDGFMPQTVEALNHAKAANVPIIIAMNKIDLPQSNPDKIYIQMQQNGMLSEEWGGDIGTVKVSAKTGAGIDKLLERILLEAEMLELKANPAKPGQAIILEAQLEQGLGPTANVLVRNGTLRIGDAVLCGEHYGKIKAMIDVKGNRVKEAGPSTPVKLVGLSGVPEAGIKLSVCKNEKEARDAAEKRGMEKRNESLVRTGGASLEDLFTQLNNEKRNNLRVIVKSDVKGSMEAIIESLKKLPSEKISVDVIHSGVGAITENDALLAASAKAVIIGFHVRVNPGVNAIAKRECVEIRLYSIIYELIEDIVDALEGRLEPEKRERELGQAKILKIFELSKGPKICGCYVEKGTVRVGAKARVVRGGELIFNGEVRSLRRFQDDVKEVKAGLECGIKLDNFMDFMENDIINVYEIDLKKSTLS